MKTIMFSISQHTTGQKAYLALISKWEKPKISRRNPSSEFRECIKGVKKKKKTERKTSGVKLDMWYLTQLPQYFPRIIRNMFFSYST